MRSHRSRVAATIAVCGLVAGIASSVGSAGRSPSITSTSIAGVKLGATMAQAKAKLGKPSQRSIGTNDNPNQPDNWIRLSFPNREVSVYFLKGDPHAVMLTTWNKNDRTAVGVHPCMVRGKVLKAYGTAIKQSTHTGPKGGYTVGRNLYIGFDGPPSSPSQTVTAIGIHSTKVDEGYATFVTLSEENCF
jgi:hypothetical protein